MTVCNPQDLGKTVVVRLIFDSGSQHTYVTKCVRKRLGLRTMGRHIATFGAENSKRKSCDVVKIVVQIRGERDVTLTSLNELIIY